MKPIRIGRYVMFDTPIVVWLVTGTDSGVKTGWTESSWLTMEIAAHPSWSETFGYALHETMEIGFFLRKCHFKPHGSLINDAVDSYLFVARHFEFTDVCRAAGDFMVYMIPALQKAYKKANKGGGK